MRFQRESIILLANVFLEVASGAPLIKTITHTAPAVTHWVTTSSVSSTTAIRTISSSPPPAAPIELQATTLAVTPDTSSKTETTILTSSSLLIKITSSTAITTTQLSATSAPPQTTTSSSSKASSSASATTSDSSNETQGLDEFESDILAAHNAKRDLHGVPHLKWNSDLAKYAADYAASSFSCDNVKLIHSGGPYGENLAAGYSGGTSPVEAWYNEIDSYNFDKPGFSEATGHFTQVVWKSTSEVGCARVTCNNVWRQYTICEYTKTRGNIVGTDSNGKSYFEENVLKPVK